MKHTPHNPGYKLVKMSIPSDKGYINLVYGETNAGEKKGLEVYFYKAGKLGHYKSYRYLEIDVPAKYRTNYVNLRKHVRNGEVKEGCRLALS